VTDESIFDPMTITEMFIEAGLLSFIFAPFFLGWYVILSDLLGHITTLTETIIVLSTVTGLIVLICCIAYLANRPERKYPELQEKSSKE
jgi:hypothetical protein